MKCTYLTPNNFFGQTLHKATATHTFNVSKVVYPSGVQVVQAVCYPNTVKKADRVRMLADLVNHGFSQKNAAEALNMSPSYASILLKKFFQIKQSNKLYPSLKR